jgi:CheY-like chemotaxis protein
MSIYEGKLAVIIEDDRVGIKVLEQMLNQLSVQTVVISDSINITEKLAELTAIPDVFFIDLEMPKNNGYTVLSRIQEMPKFDGIPTVVYTTHTSHLNEALDLGFHSFLGKPLESERFPDQLQRILENTPVWEVPG